MEKESIKQGIIIILFIFSTMFMINSYNQVNQYILEVEGSNNIIDKEFNIITYNSYIVQLIESVGLVITTFILMLVRLGQFSITEQIKEWITK